MKKYEAVIFDLDGTLLNTLDDLTDAVNHTLRQYHYPEREKREIRSFLGNGMKVLIQLSLPKDANITNFDEIFHAYDEYYTAHCQINTKPYDGIMELLDKLDKNGYKLAIVSNKQHAAVAELNDTYFSKYIKTAIGEQEGVNKKPAPDTVLKALEELGCDTKNAVYIGDSEVDRQTAINSNMDCISVTWGFRDRDLLESLKPYAIIDKPDELLQYV